MSRDRGAINCESMCQLKMTDLRKQHVLTYNGCTMSLKWLGTTIWVRSEGDRLKLTYGPFSKTVHYIGITWSRTAFSGRRQWLRCPDCGRRCGVLYIRSAAWRCRLCYRLTYQSQYVAPWERRQKKAEKVHVRLGGSGDISEGLPDKPRGMHWRTYEHLAAKCDEAETAWTCGALENLMALKCRPKRANQRQIGAKRP